MEISLVTRFFNSFSREKLLAFKELLEQVLAWNEKINLISRKDTEKIVENHLLPSLAIAKICPFPPRLRVLDVGTGGGFPGLPLAIVFPEVQFTLVDSIGKKINVIKEMATALNLKNVTALHTRIEDYPKKVDFAIGRAVTQLPRFISWVQKNLRPGSQAPLPNGVLYLKGGSFQEEIKESSITKYTLFELEPLFEHQFCQDKCLIHIPFLPV